MSETPPPATGELFIALIATAYSILMLVAGGLDKLLLPH